MALAKHILEPQDLIDMDEMSRILSGLAEAGKLLIAANSNLPFLPAYPALLPYVTKVSGQGEISSSIATIRLLNRLM